jgi:hypothetical protein
MLRKHKNSIKEVIISAKMKWTKKLIYGQKESDFLLIIRFQLFL